MRGLCYYLVADYACSTYAMLHFGTSFFCFLENTFWYLMTSLSALRLQLYTSHLEVLLLKLTAVYIAQLSHCMYEELEYMRRSCQLAHKSAKQICM